MPTQIVGPCDDDRVVTRTEPMWVTMTATLAKAIQRLAHDHDRSVAHEIRAALRAHVEREGEVAS